MAPGRKKGANKSKGKSQLSLGDLVLAKVKGFPFWPAKISQPEDWKLTPDPKKYFVHFFGTKEIAFVGPTDIQAFTDEVKSKLMHRCQSKGSGKHFAQAVKEICAAYEELQKEKASGLGDDTDRSAVGSEAPSVDGMDDDGVEVELNARKEIVGSKGETSDAGGCISSMLEHGFHKEDETESEDVKPPLSCVAGTNLSPVLEKPSSEKNEASNVARENSNCAKSNDERILVNGRNSKMPDNGSKRNVVDGNQKNNREHVKDKERVTSGNNGRDIFSDALKRDPESNGVKEEKPLPKSKKRPNVLDHLPETVGTAELSNKKKREKPGLGKAIGTFHPSKKLKRFDDETNKGFVTIIAMGDSSSSNVDNDEAGELPMTPGRRGIILALKARTGKAKSVISQMGKVKSSTSSQMTKVKSDLSGGKGKVKSAVSSEAGGLRNDGFQTGKIKSDVSSQASTAKSSVAAQVEKVKPDVPSDEAVLPLSKRRRWALEAMSDSGTLPVNKMESSPVELKDNSNSNTPRVLAAQPPKRQRAVCLFEEDGEDEEPRTPVHGGSSRNSKEIPSHRNDVRNGLPANERKGSDQLGKGDLGKFESSLLKNATQLHKASVSPGHQRTVKRLDAHSHHPRSPTKSDTEQLPSSEDKPVLASSKSSPHLNSVSRPAVDQQKTTKALVKASTVNNQKRSQAGSVKVLAFSNNTHSYASSQKGKPASGIGTPKNTPKAIQRMSDSTVLIGTPTYTEVGRIEDMGISLAGADSVMSMKHLIAAAQAKRREAHSQHFAIGYPNVHFMSLNDAQGVSSSPSLAQPFPSATNGATQADAQGSNSQASLVSPSAPGLQSASGNQVDVEEIEERVVSSGQRAAGGSLSGGTEAAVARDAFEGMIETLSRTKESIGRATRLAIDCAKYGIANEVVELLIRKLESESSFHRKVDLFFLVDSITQCSHNQKGIAGASYVPTIQAALPRLLGAAAPSGGSGRENRRQCLKVLRLWLERKILPESLLRRHIDEIGGSNDDTSCGFSSRRPSRAERAVDDPIREMEGMFVDEYGSNATFQLPGFISSNVFEDDDEEDIPGSPCKEDVDMSPLAEATDGAGELETSTATPNDRRHCILEDVDGELEMEDVSGPPKEDRPLFVNSSFETDGHQQFPGGILDSASGNSPELPPVPEGSPPLPPGSPPPPPPLPTSPPPPPPPSPPASPSPPPPPPPTLSQPPLPPPPMQPPPPPPPMQPPLPPPPPPHMPPLGPPSLLTQSAMPTQPSILPQPVLQSHSSIQSSPQLAYQNAGNQIIQMPGNSLPQQSTGFAPTAICNPGEPSGFNSSKKSEYGHNEINVNPQAPQPNPHFQPPNAPFGQRPLPHNLLQSSSGHFAFTKPPMQQHPQHMYPGPYPLPSHPDGQRRFVADEHWRPPTNEYNIDNQHNAWMSGRNPSHPGPPFNQEGYFRPPLERPPPNNMGYQHAATSLAVGAPIPGHGVPQMLPARPDMPALNCWRPA